LLAVMGNGLDRQSYLCMNGSCTTSSCCLEKSEAAKEMSVILNSDRRFEIRRSRSDSCLGRQEVCPEHSDDDPGDPDVDRWLGQDQEGDLVIQEEPMGQTVASEAGAESPEQVQRERVASIEMVSPASSDALQMHALQQTLVHNSSASGASISINPAWPVGPMSPRETPVGGARVAPAALRGPLAQHQQAAMTGAPVKRTASATILPAAAVAPRMKSSPCWTTAPQSPRVVLTTQGLCTPPCGAAIDVSRMRAVSHGISGVSSLPSFDVSTASGSTTPARQVASSVPFAPPALSPCAARRVSPPPSQQQQRQQQQQQQQQQQHGPPQPMLPQQENQQEAASQHADGGLSYHTPPPPLSTSVMAAAASAAAAGRLAMSKETGNTPGAMDEMNPQKPKVSLSGGVRNIRNSHSTPKGSRAGSARFSNLIATARSLGTSGFISSAVTSTSSTSGLSSVCHARDEEANMPLFYVTD